MIPGKADGKHGESTSSFPPNLGWVEPENAKASLRNQNSSRRPGKTIFWTDKVMAFSATLEELCVQPGTIISRRAEFTRPWLASNLILIHLDAANRKKVVNL